LGKNGRLAGSPVPQFRRLLQATEFVFEPDKPAAQRLRQGVRGASFAQRRPFAFTHRLSMTTSKSTRRRQFMRTVWCSVPRGICTAFSD